MLILRHVAAVQVADTGAAGSRGDVVTKIFLHLYHIFSWIMVDSPYIQLLAVSQARSLVTSLWPCVSVVTGMVAAVLTSPRTTCTGSFVTMTTGSFVTLTTG